MQIESRETRRIFFFSPKVVEKIGCRVKKKEEEEEENFNKQSCKDWSAIPFDT